MRIAMYDKKMAREIVAYLRENPYAGDSLEGISRWWLMRQRVSESVDAVREVLEHLRNKGCLYECSLADGRKVYYATPANTMAPGDDNSLD
jgi:hypothetical protein